MEIQTNNSIMCMTNFRCKLHNLFENQEIFDAFLSFVLNKISTINYYVDHYNKCIITLKIRKSVYKKSANFIHNVLYYEPIMNSVYTDFLVYISKLGIIDPYTGLQDECLTIDNINSIINDNISLLYNITCISDNIVILHI